MNIIEVKNLNYYYDDIHIIDIDELKIKKGSWVAIVGKNSCGKTTLLKLLGGKILTNNSVLLDNTYINKLNEEIIKQKTAYFLKEKHLFSKTVYEQLLLTTDNQVLIKKILKRFNLIEYIDYPLYSLTEEQKILLRLCEIFLKKPNVIFLDNPFSTLSNEVREEFYNLIYEYTSYHEITVISTLNDLYDSLYFDRIIVLNNKSILLDGNPYYIFKEEKLLKKLGLNIPIIYELSEKLKLYGLIDRNVNTDEELVVNL